MFATLNLDLDKSTPQKKNLTLGISRAPYNLMLSTNKKH